MTKKKCCDAAPVPVPALENTPLVQSNVLWLSGVILTIGAIGQTPIVQDRYPTLAMWLTVVAAASWAAFKAVTHFYPTVSLFPTTKP